MLRATLRALVAHKLRLLLTGLSVVIGVGFLAGTLVFTDTLKATFDGLVGRTSQNLSVVVRAESNFGSSDIGANTDRALVPESLIAQVKKVDGVKDAVGAIGGSDLLVTADGRPVEPKSPGPPTLAVSWTPSNFGSLTFVKGRGPAGPGEVAIDKAAADSYGLKVGDPVTVQTQTKPMPATIVGIATVGGSSNLAGAVLSVFDVPTAQQVTGKPGFVNQIDVEAANGVAEAELADRIGATLPANYEAVTGKTVQAEQSAAIDKALGFFNIFLLIFAGVALFVGLFIILNTFTMLVAQRTRELALLRAIGANRRQVLASVLGEAGVVGVVASTAGLALGFGVAMGVRGLLSAVGVDMPAGGLVIKSHTVVAAYLVGIVVTMVAAAFPAIRASRIPPVAAMRDGVALPERSLRVRALVGAGLTLVGVGLIAASIGGSGSGAAARVGIGALIVMIGVWVMSALLSRPIVHAIGAPIAKLFPAVGSLARSNAIRNPRRTAATAAALMIGLALVSMLSVLATSTKASIGSLVDKNLGADFVLTSNSFQGFSPDVATKVRGASGVTTVGETRVGSAHLDGKSVMLAAVSDNIGSVIKLDMADGSLPGALQAGELLVSKDTADAKHLVVGDAVSVAYPTGGTESIRVGGIFKDNDLLGNGGANYLISLPTYEKHYNTQRDAVVYVLAEPGQAVAAGKAITAALTDYPQVKVQGQAEYKDAISKQIDQFVNLIFGLLGLALLIAVLGIVNTLALSVYERIREIGLLRAIGMTRRQLRRMVRLEAAMIALFGALLGLGLGVVFGWAVVSTSGQLDQVVFPVGQLIGFVVGAGVLGVFAALVPAWRAARRPVLAAIATE